MRLARSQITRFPAVRGEWPRSLPSRRAYRPATIRSKSYAQLLPCRYRFRRESGRWRSCRRPARWWFYLHHAGTRAEQHGKVAAPPHLFTKLLLVLKYPGEANVEFSCVHRFAEVIVGAQSRGPEDHFGVPAGREHDHRDGRLNLFDLLEDIGPGHVFRGEIEQYQHGIEGTERAEGFLHSGGYGYVKVVTGEMRDQGFSGNYVVVHYQYTGLLAHRCLLGRCGLPGCSPCKGRGMKYFHTAQRNL